MGTDLLAVGSCEFLDGINILGQDTQVHKVEREFVFLLDLDKLSLNELLNMLRNGGLRVIESRNYVFVANLSAVAIAQENKAKDL